jgi:hypothetical protein
MEAFEALTDDVTSQRFDVDNDVRKFRQRLEAISQMAFPQEVLSWFRACSGL